MMLNGFLNKQKKNFGQGMVELALTLPIFLLLLYGIFEIGRLVFMYSAVLNASRDAARYAAAADAVRANDAGYQEYYKDCEGIRLRAQTVSAIVNLSASDAVLVSYDGGPGYGGMMMQPRLTCASCHAPDGLGGGHWMHAESSPILHMKFTTPC